VRNILCIVSFAKFYESHDDLDNADVIFEKAVQVHYKKVNDLATVHCEWAEMHLRHDNLDRALEIMKVVFACVILSLYMCF
jgi:pre-mRNA-splicing factor SYF1